MSRLADSLRRRGARVGTVESQGYGAQQDENEVAAEDAVVERFMSKASLSDDKILRHVTSDDGNYLVVDISSNDLTVDQARAISGVQGADTLPDPSSAYGNITRVYLHKHYSWTRNFGTGFKSVTGVAAVGFALCFGFVLWRLSGYGNAVDIATNTFKEGLGLE